MDGNLAMANSIVFAGPHDFEPEEWKDIPNYEGLYQVSTYSRVKSLDRYIKHSTEGVFRFLKGRILKPRLDKDGYETVGLYKHEKVKRKRGHQLSLIAFKGHKPGEDGMVGDHKDNNKSNNHISNLQLITSRENSTKDKPNLYIGAFLNKYTNRWVSRICIKGKRICLGSFKKGEDAAKAYKDRLEEYNKTGK